MMYLAYTILLAGTIALAAPLAPTMNIVELAASVPELSTLVTAVKAGDLVSTLSGPGPFTVFAPTNEAFAALPPGLVKKLLEPANKADLIELLTYHVAAGNVQSGDLTNEEKIKTVEGSNVTVYLHGKDVIIEGGFRGNFAMVIKADVEATNGVVHVVDHVLLPRPTAPPSPVPGTKNIIELAVSNPDLSTLVTAVKAADLVETLSGPGPFTVFAPTNEAFAKLPKAILEHLLDPKNKAELVKVLTYHVVSGNVQARDLKDGENVKTIEGTDIVVHIRDGKVILQGGQPGDYSMVIKADVEASNGVVHVIDAVLLPKQ